MSFWIVNTLNGLSLAMILFILSAGLTLIFGLMQIINMAHGSYYLVGGYIALTVVQETGNFALGLVTACTAIMLIGIAMQRLTLRRRARISLRSIGSPQRCMP